MNKILSKENKKFVLLNLFSTVIWYSFAYTAKILLLFIRDYIMPTYIIHIGFILVVLILNIRLCIFLNKRSKRKAESNLSKSKKEPLPKKSTNPFKKDEDIGYQINPKTKEVLCNKCLNEPGFAVSLDKNKSKVSVSCPRCKTIHILPFEMLSAEDFAEDSDAPTANRRPRKKAMRVSTLTKRQEL